MLARAQEERWEGGKPVGAEAARAQYEALIAAKHALLEGDEDDVAAGGGGGSAGGSVAASGGGGQGKENSAPPAAAPAAAAKALGRSTAKEQP